MAIAVGVHGIGGVGSPATSPARNSAATGSTFVAFAIFNGTFTSIADTFGNTWVQAGTAQSGIGITSRLYYVANGAGGSSHVVTFTASGTAQVTFMEITGAEVASYDLGALAAATDAASPFTVTSGTLAQAAELAVAVLVGDSGSNPATIAESTGFTVVDQDLNGAATWSNGVYSKIVAATTALTPSFTQSGSGSVMLKIIAFKEAAAGGVVGRLLSGSKIRGGILSGRLN